MDAIDFQILSMLQEDCKIPQVELARSVGLSPASISERLKRLEKKGVVKSYTAILDPHSLGISITAFVFVFVEHPSYEAELLAKLDDVPEVQECHHVTGDFSLLLKVRTKNIKTFEHLLFHSINSIPGVRQTKTTIVLSSPKETTHIPFDTPPEQLDDDDQGA
ncbi:MAG: Lrp/AsnC family transcriptional regulator [Candidatus Coatesbacteria bacterium]|nr:Lrp/AsnC family transcriptional regulator [Candidatus Coatesbacteria bacterium]